MKRDEREGAAIVAALLEKAFREGYIAGEQDARRVADKEPFLGPTVYWFRSVAARNARTLTGRAESMAAAAPLASRPTPPEGETP